MARGPATTTNGQIQRSEKQPGSKFELARWVQEHQGDFARVIPKHMDPDRMVRLSVGAIRSTKHLAECTLPSFASAIMACSVLGLEPNTPLGHAYLIPFKNNRRGGIYEVQLIIGYRGLIDLMWRSGAVSSVRCTAVYGKYEDEQFSYQKGLHPDIQHIPSENIMRGTDPNALTHVYPVIGLKDSPDPIWDVFNRGQIELRRKRSRGASSSTSPWNTDYEAMCLKTGIRAVSRWVPSSTEKPQLAQAVAYEGAHELGRGRQAIAALPESAQETIESAGSDDYPIEDSDDDTDGPDGVAVDDERQPGED